MSEDPATAARRLGAPIRPWQQLLGFAIGVAAAIGPYLLVRPHLGSARAWAAAHLTSSASNTVGMGLVQP